MSSCESCLVDLILGYDNGIIIRVNGRNQEIIRQPSSKREDISSRVRCLVSREIGAQRRERLKITSGSSGWNTDRNELLKVQKYEAS